MQLPPFQFSLRSLLLFVLVVSVALSWLSAEVDRARKQHAAVEALWMSACAASYDYIVDRSPNDAGFPEPPGPAWLRALLGDDFFCNVVSASAWCDDNMALFDDLPRLRYVYLSTGEVTDAGLAHLRRLSEVRKLSLSAR